MYKLILILLLFFTDLGASITHVRDGYSLIQTAGSSYIGNDSNQIYSINPNVIKSGDTIKIIDKGGDNTIELVKGLSISESLVTSNELLLKLSNGASINIRGADKFTFDIGGNRLSNIEGKKYNFSEFVTEILGLPTVPAVGEVPVSGRNVEISNLNPNDKYESTITVGSLKNPVIEGVQYYCSKGEDGITNEYGMFECIDAPVTFKIGGLTLGTLNKFTDGEVYLQDILGLDRDNFSDEKLKLLAWFIQSLDDDGDITQRVTITQDVRDRLTKVQDFRDMSESDVKLTLELLGKHYMPECIALKNIGANVECGSNGDYIDNPSSDSNSSSNDLSTNKETISGYVIDEPIANATIELQEINGTLIKRFESVTNADGSYSIEIDEKYKNKDFILKAYNGTISNKTFDGDLYGYHLSGDGLNINLTPLNTMLIILSSQFSDIDFSARIAKAKDLLSATYGINEDEFSSIKDSDFSNFDIVKFRELVNSIGFNSLIQSLVADSIDGYADENNSRLLFPSAKKRVLKDAKATFQIVDTNLSNEEISNLRIEGTSEDENGNKGTKDRVTDVIASKTVTSYNFKGEEKEEKQIVFRSFNVGKWRGKLNEETTFLARVFMDSLLINLPESAKVSISEKIKEDKDFKEAIQNQKGYIISPILFEAVYMDSIFEFTKKAQELVIQKLNKKINSVSKIDTNLKFYKKFFAQKNNNDLDNIGGSIRLKYDKNTNTFNFRNYHNIYMGLRVYEKNKDYGILNTLEDNAINPVRGGLLGGYGTEVIEEASDWLNLDKVVDILGTPADNPMQGKAFDSDLFETETKAKINQDKLYEIYKFQGIKDFTTWNNVLIATNAILQMGDFSKKTKKFKDEFSKTIGEASSFYIRAIEVTDKALSMIELLTLVGEYTQKLNQEIKLFDTNFIIDGSYRVENDIDNIRGLLAKIKEILPDKDRYSGAFETDTFQSSMLITLLNTTVKPKDKKLQKAIESIKDEKLKTKIYLMATLAKLSSKDLSENDFKYDYYSLDDMHYIVPLWLFLPRDKAKKVLKKYKYGSGANVGSKGIIEYGKFFSKINIKKYIEKNKKSYLKDLSDIANFSDLLRNTTRNIANTDLFSVGSLKVIISFMKDIIDIDANTVAQQLAKKLKGGYATVALGANDLVSFGLGVFILPNKMYFRVSTDDKGDINLKYPSFAVLGILSDDADEKNNWIGNKIYRKDGSHNFLMVTGSFYQPIYNVYFMAKDQSSIFENNSNFPDNTFVKMRYNIRKSTTDTVNNFTDTLGNTNNVNDRVSISPETIADGGIANFNMVKSGDYGYYFDLYEAWMVEQGTNFWVSNKTRGIYKEWIEAEFNYPKIDDIDKSITSASNERFIYKSKIGKEIGENIIVEKLEINGKDYLRIENTNDFDVCFGVKYDSVVDIIDDTIQKGDYLVKSKSVYLLPLFNFKDNEGDYNDVEFIFYDIIAQNYFEEENYPEPRYFNWKEKSNGLEDLTYNIELDDITKTDNYLMITNYGNGTQTESTLSDNGEVKVEFNMPLSSDSLNKIKVYDVNEKRYLNSDEYTVAHTSGNEYLITIKNYKNHHEYKLVFPSDLTSESGAKFLDEKEISNFIYYNQAPIAIAGEDTTITVDEIQDFKLDGSNSYDKDGTIVKMEWFYKDKLVWDGNIFPLKNLDVNNSKYVLKLVVTDNEGAIAYDEVVINILNLNIPPTANAGADQTITVDEIQDFKLNGSNSYDKDGTIVKMEWFYKDKLVWDGNIFPLKNLNVSDSKYVLKLVVTDNGGLTDSDEVVITIISNQIKHNNISTLKKTGQTISYAKYDDGFYEKGIILNYTKESADILDRTTGLIWQNGNDTNGSKKSWSDAKNYCEGLTGGWRLPTRQELSGLVRYDNYNPSIDNIFNYTTADYYWSGDDSKRVFNDVWVVSFSEGVENTTSKNNSYFVRCVKNRASLVANAGADQIVREKESVTLDGTHSPNRENIVSYKWSEGEKVLGEGEKFSISTLSDGVHKIMLTVKDKNGQLDSDEVIITVTSEKDVLKKTSQNISYAKFDDGFYEKGVAINYAKSGDNILDKSTGLTWQDIDSGQKLWEEAKSYCASLDGNWRLPTRRELSNLVAYNRYNPSIDDIFSSTTSDYYWTIDTSKRDHDKAWAVSFSEGVESALAKSNSYYVRCVQNNLTPIANAGVDQLVVEGEPVVLRATESSRPELIKSYIWLEGDKELGQGAVIELNDMIDGEHEITLVIKDENGDELSRDNLRVTIISDNRVLKQTGQNISYAKFDDGFYEKGVAINYAKRDDNILDRTTGLLWRDEEETKTETYSWQDAKDYCGSLDGHWRLPTRKELSNLIQYNRYNPSINDIFSFTASDYYWAIDISIRDRDKAWAISFSEGVESAVAKSSSYYARCVQSDFVPTANAGADILTIKETPIVLDAGNSPRKNLITKFLWENSETELGEGERLAIDTSFSGREKITLTITDKEGREDTDDLWLTVIKNDKIVKKTGQTESYADYDDGYYQKGVSLSYSDHGDSVTDNATGLEWRDDENTDTLKMTWKEANYYCSRDNSNWRLPTRRELSNLVDYGKYNPSIDESFNNTASDYYWTIDTSMRDNDKAWAISFSEGAEYSSDKSNSYYVRCVNAN